MRKMLAGAVLFCLLTAVLSGCKNDRNSQLSEETAALTAVTEDSGEETGNSVEPETVEYEIEEMTTQEETEMPEILTEEEQETENVVLFGEPREMYAKVALNVRKGPGTEFEVLSHLSAFQKIIVYGQAENGWYQLKAGEETGYCSNHYISETEIIREEEEIVKAEETKPVQQENQAPAGVIMVGDSRCVQMQEAVGGGGCSWICENGKEYNWFSEKAIPRIDGAVGKGTKVVINMGVNDPEHYRQYAELVNTKAAEWANLGAVTYFVSVNPVWENPYTTAEQVETFNANVPGMLSNVQWIDTCSWLNENGYKILDGLHYDADTYKNIFSVIMGSL